MQENKYCKYEKRENYRPEDSKEIDIVKYKQK